ncbi:hypothetical protein SAMN05421759_11060 [Roseivivax lentus]|uniref:DUF4280 domain-containing protein n=1 Tax=Roseivivax lentus TaxID=633194 RepID=A0A1N7NU61_9RHOB|nr:hypothetical protein [Roseivivax lentus]SIT01850.1 hypothetical protein SAMN05421759_11060 [Roseivivax lentus]
MSFLLHQGAQVMCSHAGQANPTTASLRVKLGGQPATTMAHTYMIAGCPFTTPEPAPKPCTIVQWTTPATRLRIEGQPALLSTSQGICNGPLGVQGTPQVVMQQTRVRGQ